jgi:hypothetical protein
MLFKIMKKICHIKNIKEGNIVYIIHEGKKIFGYIDGYNSSWITKIKWDFKIEIIWSYSDIKWGSYNIRYFNKDIFLIK